MRRTSKYLFTLLCIGLFLIVQISQAAAARQVQLNALLSNRYVLEGEKKRLFLKIGLKGFEFSNNKSRVPINIAVVIDRSGSMQGEKLERAKEAAIFAIEKLDSRDIVSVVLYDHLVNVLVPATRVADRHSIIKAIRNVEAGGSTALFAGVSKGAAEVRKFLTGNQVNRIILLSDGMANVGPDTPGAFDELGASLVEEGISVTTIGLGLGYNEDLMSTLARASDGNHAFVENSGDLMRIFDYEFSDVLSVVAQDVALEVECSQGIRPVRVLGRDADIADRSVYAHINQLYSSQEKYILLEVELPQGRNGTTREVARVNVSYSNMETKAVDKLTGILDVQYTDSEEIVRKNENRDVMVAAIMQVATLMNAEAVILRDKGDLDGAQVLLQENAMVLKTSAELYNSELLSDYSTVNFDDAQNLDDSVWNERRKSMTKDQYANSMQQSY